jgi:hypothetical protein
VIVEPGSYQVSLTIDQDQEIRHYFFEEAAQYPLGDGPDWCLRLQKV